MRRRELRLGSSIRRLGASMGLNAQTFSLLGFSPALWVGGDVGMTLAGSPAVNNGKFDSWLDQSGNGKTITQSTGVNQGTVLAGYQNGLPVASFTGSAFYSSASAIATDTTGLTFFSVLKPSSNALYTNLYDNLGATPMFWKNDTDHYEIDTASGATTAATYTDALHVVVARSSPSGQDIWVDGTKVATGTLAVTIAASLPLTFFSRGGSNGFQGVVGEYGFIGTLASDATVRALSATLKGKWSTP